MALPPKRWKLPPPPSAENHLAKVGDLEADSEGKVTLDALRAAM